MQRGATLTCLALGALAGCSRSDAGSGTETILAAVEVQASAASTLIEARLSLRGSALSGASVVLSDEDAGRAVTLEGRPGGLYRGALGGYAQVLGLQVRAGADHLEATLEGPTPHVVTRPPDGARVRRGGFETLKVTWDAEDVAERVEVSVGATTTSVDGTEWTAELPLSSIADGDHTLRVTRQTSIDLAGGVAGSRMRSRYEVDNRFTLER